MKNNLNLYYQTSSNFWEEALPLGNGTLGAMIFGGVKEEKIALNHDSIWSGFSKKTEFKSRRAALLKARQLILDGKLIEANEFIRDEVLDSECQSYMPAGNLIIKSELENAEQFERKLDISNAMHSKNFVANNIKYSNVAFISQVDQVMVLKLSANRQKSCSYTFKLESELVSTTEAIGNKVFLNEQAPEHNRYQKTIQGSRGIKAQVAIEIDYLNGTKVINPDNSISINNADEITLYLSIVTNFVSYDKSLKQGFATLKKRNLAILKAAKTLGFKTLKTRHQRDYKKLFNRSIMEMPENANSSLPTDQRLVKNKEEIDLNLIALFYNYGRYLMISGSRENSQAMNLQGIWNHHFHAPWGCNYTTNINTQMNYWPSEHANLSECANPLFQFINDSVTTGKAYAKKSYGFSGWCLHHNSDIWRFAGAARRDTRWGYFPLGSAWLCEHIFERYNYTNDVDFLRKNYYVLEEACKFALDLIYFDSNSNEYYMVPSTSPENVFIVPDSAGKTAAASCNSTMDWSFTYELFRNTLESMQIINKKDAKLASKLTHVINHLKRPKIGNFGELLEYDLPYEEAEITHRHVSHLYGIFPGNFISESENNDLFEAAKITLERRGDYSTGWAIAWRLILQARFKNSEKVNLILQNLFTLVTPKKEMSYDGGGGVYANLFDAHPPFQIDGNFGATTGIIEAIMQSHRKNADGLMILELLPALPKEWHSGKLFGIKARGNLTIDIAWENNKISELSIKGAKPITFELRTPDKREIITIK